MSKSNGLVPLFGYGAVCGSCGCTEEVQPSADAGPVAEADAIAYLISSGWHQGAAAIWQCSDCWNNRWDIAEKRSTLNAVRFGGIGGPHLQVAVWPDWATSPQQRKLSEDSLPGNWQLREVDGQRWLVELPQDRRTPVLPDLPF